ncbi:MAG: hypothetical protein K1X64_20220 [Myxococcaceae bacterium]|nr:hypothetical protein [Myxococcaceae bacterium]
MTKHLIFATALAITGVLTFTGCPGPDIETECLLSGRCGDGGIDAGIDAGVDAGSTFCDRLEVGLAHLKNVLEKCPGSGDDALIAFSRSKCDAQAATQCTTSERASYDAVIVCERDIAVCASATERSRAQNAISTCATDAGSVSNQCASSIQP